MTYEQFNIYCASLRASEMVFQWGGSYVWKVGGKVFAIGGWEQDQPAFTFKVSDGAYEVLKDQPGLRGAPYFASRGMKWIQHYDAPGLDDEQLQDFLLQSYQLVVAKLTRKRRTELKLDAPGASQEQV